MMTHKEKFELLEKLAAQESFTTVDVLRGSNRIKSGAEARWIVAYIGVYQLGMTIRYVSEIYNRHPTTLVHGVKVLKKTPHLMERAKVVETLLKETS